MVGKSKHLTKGGRKGAKKKMVDPFLKKDWFTRAQGSKIASEGLKGRVFEVSLADLQDDEVALENSSSLLRMFRAKSADWFP
ncbi:hypothetical protein QTO34_013542 [Cnephaeus nilssonii]|uniref:40S ribosomal protein S3a n=1 Tax=Cnephaeus nilssonii TaxID=3371016 RepID=A0AA40I868_CNENI|nr:hypothetical protein QTO34_013542 [Eptesicus nilssonii]